METKPLPIPITSIDQERFMEVLEQLKIEVGNMKTNFENFLIPAPLEVPKPTAKKERVVNFSTVGKKSEGFGSSLLKYALLFAVAFNDKVREIAAEFIGGFLTQLGVNDKIVSAVKWSILNFDKILIAYLGFKVLKQVFGAFNSVQKLFKAIKTLFSLHTDQEFDRDTRIKQLEKENKNLERKLRTAREQTKTAKAKAKARLERVEAKHKKKVIDMRTACNKRAAKLRERIKTNRTRANLKSNVINKIKEVLVKTKQTFKKVAVAAKKAVQVVTQKLNNVRKIVTHAKKVFGIVRKGLSVLRTGLVAAGTALGPLGLLLGFAAGLLIDAAIGTVIDLTLDTEADPKESLFDKIIRVGLKNVFSSFSFGFLDDIPDFVKKRLGIPVKGDESRAESEQKPAPANIDPKVINNWAYSVFVNKNKIEEVPPQLRSKVEEILKNPPSNWKTSGAAPNAAPMAATTSSASAAPMAATTGQSSNIFQKAMQQGGLGGQPYEYKQSKEGASISSQIKDLQGDLGISDKELQSQMEIDSSGAGQQIQSLSETKTLSVKSAQKAMSGSPVVVVTNNNNTVLSNQEQPTPTGSIVFSDNIGF